jgi:hypothetical protein
MILSFISYRYSFTGMDKKDDAPRNAPPGNVRPGSARLPPSDRPLGVRGSRRAIGPWECEAPAER